MMDDETQAWSKRHGGTLRVTLGFSTVAALVWLLVVQPLRDADEKLSERIEENKADLKALREEFSYYKGMIDSKGQ